MVEPKPGDQQHKNRCVYIDIDEEDFFDMLDKVNPKNIVKYLDMRKVNHRDALEINVTSQKVVLTGGFGEKQKAAQRGLYRQNKRNQKKLNRALLILDNMRKTEKL